MVYVNEELNSKFETSKPNNKKVVKVVSLHQSFSRERTPNYKARRLWARIVIVCVLLFGISNIGPVKEGLSVVFYSGSSQIKQISEQSGMNIHGKAIFYSTSPELVDYPTLLKYCPNDQVDNVEFGCYLPTYNKIYILNITDVRLAPLMAVTAAHEMLHKSFSSLDATDRQAIASQVNAAEVLAISDVNNADYNTYKDMIQPYLDAKLSPEGLTNELHSLIGTEITVTNPELLTYYDKYFLYQSTPVGQYILQKQNIASIEAELNAETKVISNYKTTVLDRDTANQNNIENYANRSYYNGNYDNYSRNIDIYNSNLPGMRERIAYYNKLVDAYNTKLADYQAIFTNLKAEQSAPDATSL